MSKIRPRVLGADLQHEFPFFNAQENFDAYYNRFLSCDLSKIYFTLPLDTMVSTFKLKENQQGTKNYFSPKGKLALMLLKHYSGCSDKRLIEQLNSNIDYQFFLRYLFSRTLISP